MSKISVEWCKENWQEVDVYEMVRPNGNYRGLMNLQQWCLEHLGSLGTVWFNDPAHKTWYCFYFFSKEDALAFVLANAGPTE